eukprot:11165103-Lingulodinium_polyedra.AAC.1
MSGPARSSESVPAVEQHNTRKCRPLARTCNQSSIAWPCAVEQCAHMSPETCAGAASSSMWYIPAIHLLP